MATYLLTWNPQKYHWTDLQHDVQAVQRRGFCCGTWSVGGSKQINSGDRLFLMRQGPEPRGLVGSGWAESQVDDGTHWDGSGKLAQYVKVYFDVLHNPVTSTLLPRTDLKQGMLAKMHWDSQQSGIRIPDEVATALEAAWARCLRTAPTHVPAAHAAAIEGLVTEMRTYARSRSRRLRDQALREAHGVCCVCEVDFSQLLDGDGVHALQVHHRAQLAAHDAPRLTRLEDLAVVCATCHALIHMNPRRALSIEALKAKLTKSV